MGGGAAEVRRSSTGGCQRAQLPRSSGGRLRSQGFTCGCRRHEEAPRLGHRGAGRGQRRPRQRCCRSHRRSCRPGERGRTGQGRGRDPRRPGRRRTPRHGAGRRPRRFARPPRRSRRSRTRWRRSRLDRPELVRTTHPQWFLPLRCRQVHRRAAAGLRLRAAVHLLNLPDARCGRGDRCHRRVQNDQGGDKLATYRFNTNTAEHHFCTQCGIYTHHKRRSNPTSSASTSLASKAYRRSIFMRCSSSTGAGTRPTIPSIRPMSQAC